MSSSNQDISIENTDLLTEISVAYYQDGATQEEISRKFAISRAKVGRMLKQARDEASLKSPLNITRYSAPRLSNV